MRLILAILLFAFAASAQMPPRVMDDLLMAVSSPAPSSLLNSLTAYWKFDTNSLYADSSGNGYTLSVNGTIYGTNGLLSQAAAFNNNQANNLYTADADVWSAINSNSMTFACWVYLNATNAVQTLIRKDTVTAGTREYQLYYNNNPARFEWALNTNAASGSTFTFARESTYAHTIGAWYFVVASIDSTNWIAQLRVGTSATLGAWNNSAAFNGFGPNGKGTNTTAIFLISQVNNTLPLNGRLDEFGVWQRLLTDSEITNLWNSGIGRTYPFQ